MTNDSTNKPHDPVVDHLERLAAQDDRASLAALRSSLREGRELDALRVVLPYLPRNAAKQHEADASLLAGLFALHPESGSLSLAAALRLFANDSDSIELRFRAMLSADREDLDTHLRHAVSLVSSRHVGIDWRDLHQTIRNWTHAESWRRRVWARDFWAPNEPEHTSSTEATQET